MKTAEEIMYELKACELDTERFQCLLDNKDEPCCPTLFLDNDLTYVSVEICDDEYMTVDFDDCLGWSGGVQDLLATIGIRHDCV